MRGMRKKDGERKNESRESPPTISWRCGNDKKNTDTHTHTLGELTDTFKLNLYAFFNQLILFYLSIYFFTKHTSDHYFHP